MRAIWVLLWKNAIIRKRRYILTTLEPLTALFFFILLFVFRKPLTPRLPPELLQRLGVRRTEPVDLMTATAMPQTIFFYPDNVLTRDVMDLACYSLYMNVTENTPDHERAMSRRACVPLPSRESLDEHIRDLRLDEAVIIFEGAFQSPKSGDVRRLPDRLSYTIRMNENFMTHVYEALDDSNGPHENFGIIYEPFMRVQWAIDSSYISLRRESPLRQRVQVQEFAHNETVTMISQMIALRYSLVRFLCVSGLSFVFLNMVMKLSEERATGVQELIKMAGVRGSTIVLSYIMDATPIALLFSVVATVLLTVTEDAIVQSTHWSLVFVMLLLQYYNIVALAFLVTYLITSRSHLMSMSLGVFYLLFLLALYTHRDDERPAALLALPHMPNCRFWLRMGVADESVARSPGGAQLSDVVDLYLVLVAQSAVFGLVAWYASQVLPGKHGVPRPWNFLFTTEYWSSSVKPSSASVSEAEEEQVAPPDERFFERPPADRQVGIELNNVTKEYGSWHGRKFRALSNVSLEIYKGEITVLLGHNGAGKTTLNSIVTGMQNATSGSVYVLGYHSVKQRSALHKHIGLCPQDNMFFTDLTVLEHIMFFSMLKGGSCGAARASAMDLLRDMHLEDKAHSRVSALSGGMMRRLQLTIALAGGADVLILDEPTSGLDVETRRDLWNKLLLLRGEKTVVLTTHFMEEADALGDRVALLHAGRLKCHATPMFLKKAIGSGYRLTLAAPTSIDEASLTHTIHRHIPEATVMKHEFNTVTYGLPASQSAKFPKLFNELEAKKETLGIDYMGVGVTTLEEVFLQLGRDSDDEIDNVGNEAPPQFTKKSGWRLARSQVVALFKRLARFTYSKKYIFIIFETLIPLLFIWGVTSLTNSKGSDAAGESQRRLGGNKTAMDLELYRRMGDSAVMYRVYVDTPVSVAATARRFDSTKVERIGDPNEDISKLAMQKKLLSIIELNDTDAKVHFTTTVRHAAPTGLNLLSNMLASMYLNDSVPDTITTYNDPVISGETRREVAKMFKGKDKFMVTSWLCLVCFCLHLACLSNVVLVIRERVTGARSAYIMCGTTPTTYWLSTLAFHLLLATAVVILPTLVILAVVERDGTVGVTFILSMWLSAGLGTLSFLAFMYAMSFSMGPIKSQLLLMILIGLFGAYGSLQAIHSLWNPNATQSIFKRIIVTISKMIPAYYYMLSFYKTGEVTRLNALCSNNRALCPAIPVTQEDDFDLAKCCGSTGDMISMFSGHKMAPLAEWFTMIIMSVLYMGLTILTQYGYLSGSWDYFFNTLLKKYKPTESPYNNEHISKEADYVSKIISKPQAEIKESLVVHDLHKNYYKCWGKSVNAVRGVNFTVKKGECFGLLGVNGAGKSTTFKLLTMEGKPTRGRMLANGHSLSGNQRHDYLWSVSYCPQLFGLDEFLTGRQTLRLLLALAGLHGRDARRECDTWLELVGLTKYADRVVSTYSGGCVRRLGTAAALCRRAPLALLDEPTAGVDPASRRRVWRALKTAGNSNSSVVISSHSMDEMEALCHRIAILNQGWVCALGDLASLRRAHAAGHSLQIKLKRETTPVKIQKFKEDIKHKFKCVLKDEHKSMLTYNIEENVPYSEMFTRIEQLKESHPIIEDYTVHEMTLEQVFLNLAHGDEPKRQHV